MQLIDTLNKLKSDEIFNEFKKNNKYAYFSYGFKIMGEKDLDGWQLGFYTKDNDKVTTFTVSRDKIEVNPEEEVFKKPSMKVNEINLEKIKLPLEQIMDKANEFKKKNYPNEIDQKIIVIVQNLEGFGDIWNITFITKAFNTLNIKISTEDGKILKHNLSSVFDFKKEG
jgi:hypothetical protein